MALKFDVNTEEGRIDEQGMARRFGTNLPESATSSAGQKQLAAAQLQLGEQLMRTSGREITERNAQMVDVAKDPETGKYVRPETPLLMGLAHRDAYNRIVDDRYTQTVYRDVEADLNKIAAEDQFDPIAAHRKMTEIVNGTLENVDPLFQARLGPILQREVSERHRGILSNHVARDRQNSISFFGKDIEQSMDSAESALEIGDEAR